MTITEFLEARIAEDEAVARDRPSSAHIHESGCYYYNYSLDASWFCDCDEDGSATRRLLAECAAKRAIVQMALDSERYGCGTITDGVERETWGLAVRALAAVYADHPDYDPGWAL